MRESKTLDYVLLTILAIIWASAFFNIKIATDSFPALTIAFLRIFLGAIPVVLLCYVKKIRIEAFSKDWYWFAAIGFINLVIPFYLIAYGVKNVQSNLAAILMASTPLTAAALAHFFTKNEKINLIKSVGVLIGFSGIIFLFSDNILINENNIFSAFLILFGSCFYVIGGLLTLKISNKENENVTASILIWGSLILFPISIFVDKSWNLFFPIFYSKFSIFSFVALSRNFFYRSSLAVTFLYIKTQRFSFSGSSCLPNTNFWSNFRFFNFK